MSVAIICLGTELTRGEVRDENGGWLAQRLSDLGHEVVEIAFSPDDDERIRATLERLSSLVRVIVCAGGLGPTTDDRTAACVADLIGQPLEPNRAALEVLHETLRARGREPSAESDKQVCFPAGAEVIPNRLGTAPGFSVEIASSRAYFLPGVPLEMRTMFDEEVTPRLPAATAPPVVRYLRTHGLPESEVGRLLRGVESAHGVTIGYRATDGETALKVMASDAIQAGLAAGTAANTAAESAANRVEHALADLEARLGSAIYARHDIPLEEVVLGHLIDAGLTVALAESCTGGLVSEMLTRTPGAGPRFRGGIVAYDNEVKAAVLDVPAEVLQKHGAVSEPVARAMAEGARRRLGADFGVSLTGIAGPSGGSPEKPVGLVHWAVAGPQGTVAERAVFSGNRQQVRKRAALAALWTLRTALRQ